MTDEMKQQIIKAHIFGHSAADITAQFGLSSDGIGRFIAENAEEINAEREYRARLEGAQEWQ